MFEIEGYRSSTSYALGRRTNQAPSTIPHEPKHYFQRFMYLPFFAVEFTLVTPRIIHSPTHISMIASMHINKQKKNQTQDILALPFLMHLPASWFLLHAPHSVAASSNRGLADLTYPLGFDRF